MSAFDEPDYAAINRLEDAEHQAGQRMVDVADEFMWTMRTLKRTSSGGYAAVIAAFELAEVPDADDLVRRWMEAHQQRVDVRRELATVRGY